MIETAASKSFTAVRMAPSVDRMSPLVWLNLVCLDAPIVAVSWHCLFARQFGIALAFGPMSALVLTAWLIYLADRFVDTLTANPAGAMSLRQCFCLRHRRALFVALPLIAIADAALVLATLDGTAVGVGITVGLCALGYL